MTFGELALVIREIQQEQEQLYKEFQDETSINQPAFYMRTKC